MKKFVFIVISAIMVSACNTSELEFDNVEIQPITGIYAVPIGDVTYTMRELIERQADEELDLQEDSTSFLTLIYTDTLGFEVGDEFVQIGDINQNGTVAAIVPNVGPASFTINESFNVAYDPVNGEQLDSAFYETGDLTITTNSTINGIISYTYTIQNTTNVTSGNPITLSGILNGPGTDTENASLINHVTRLTDPSGDNTFVVDLIADVTLAGGQSTTGTESFTFDLTYGNQSFSLIYGKFGRDTVQVGAESINVEFFREMGEEGIFFGDPKLKFDFRNSFGVPVGVDFSGLYGADEDGSNQVFLTGDIVDNPPVVFGSDPTTPAPNIPGEIRQTDVEINRSNSNLVQLLSSSPAQLVFDVGGFSNPESLDSVNYLQPTSRIDGFIELEIPMEIRLENLEQSFNVSLGDGFDTEDVDSLFLRVNTLNELPFSAVLTMEIQDENDSTLYTTEEAPVLVAPFINVSGLVTDPNGITTDIPIGPEGVLAFENGRKIVMTVVLNTPLSLTSRDIFVKILADYALEIKLGLGGRVNVDL